MTETVPSDSYKAIEQAETKTDNSTKPDNQEAKKTKWVANSIFINIIMSVNTLKYFFTHKYCWFINYIITNIFIDTSVMHLIDINSIHCIPQYKEKQQWTGQCVKTDPQKAKDQYTGMCKSYNSYINT